MVSTTRVDSYDENCSLSCPSCFLPLSGICCAPSKLPCHAYISRRVQTQAEIIENTSLPSLKSPAPPSPQQTDTARLRAPPPLIRVKSPSLITQRKERQPVMLRGCKRTSSNPSKALERNLSTKSGPLNVFGSGKDMKND